MVIELCHRAREAPGDERRRQLGGPSRLWDTGPPVYGTVVDGTRGPAPHTMKLIIQIPCKDEAAQLPATLADLPRELPGFDTSSGS